MSALEILKENAKALTKEKIGESWEEGNVRRGTLAYHGKSPANADFWWLPWPPPLAYARFCACCHDFVRFVLRIFRVDWRNNLEDHCAEALEITIVGENYM